MKIVILITCFVISHGVMAFGDLGHKMVAKAAWLDLTPRAKQHIQRLLGGGEARFIQASVWADNIKSNKTFDHLKPLHYVNLPKEASNYVRARDCHNNKCIVEAIKEYSETIISGHNKEPLLALRMLIHLIGDIHQPLHAGLFEDRGGNRYDIKYQGKRISLHRFWDNQIVKRFHPDLEQGAKKIAANTTNVNLGNPVQWAQESHAITVNSLYLAAENKALSDEYLVMADAIIEKQLHRGAKRLAMWLNQIWP